MLCYVISLHSMLREDYTERVTYLLKLNNDERSVFRCTFF